MTKHVKKFGHINDQRQNNLTDAEIRRRRHFNAREREAIYILSGGICANCNEILDENWEPDHVLAYSRGGETSVENGAALCRSCNRAKGAK